MEQTYWNGFRRVLGVAVFIAGVAVCASRSALAAESRIGGGAASADAAVVRFFSYAHCGGVAEPTCPDNGTGWQFPAACSGVAITSTTFLTAGHCTPGRLLVPALDNSDQCGGGDAYYPTLLGFPAPVAEVVSVIAAPGYAHDSISIVTLDSPVFGAVAPISSALPVRGATYTLTGYSPNSSLPAPLQNNTCSQLAGTQTLTGASYNDWFRAVANSNVSAANVLAFPGDSGGPMVGENGLQGVLYGVNEGTVALVGGQYQWQSGTSVYMDLCLPTTRQKINAATTLNLQQCCPFHWSKVTANISGTGTVCDGDYLLTWNAVRGTWASATLGQSGKPAVQLSCSDATPYLLVDGALVAGSVMTANPTDAYYTLVPTVPEATDISASCAGGSPGKVTFKW